jgi:hypothetical protein
MHGAEAHCTFGWPRVEPGEEAVRDAVSGSARRYGTRARRARHRAHGTGAVRRHGRAGERRVRLLLLLLLLQLPV